MGILNCVQREERSNFNIQIPINMALSVKLYRKNFPLPGNLYVCKIAGIKTFSNWHPLTQDLCPHLLTLLSAVLIWKLKLLTSEKANFRNLARADPPVGGQVARAILIGIEI